VSIQDANEGLAGINMTALPSEGAAGLRPLLILEGQTVEVEVILLAPADQVVVVRVEGPESEDLDVTPRQLVFGAASYDTPQLLRISAARDGIDAGEGASRPAPPLRLVAESLTPAYHRLSVEMELQVAEADIAGVVISPRGLELVEGGDEGVVRVSLATVPTQMVTIELEDPTLQLSLYPRQLVFLPYAAPAPQEVRVLAPLDGRAATDRRVDVYLNPDSADPLYNSYGGVLRVTVRTAPVILPRHAPLVYCHCRIAVGEECIFFVRNAVC
jgi:hypothetical protein